MRSRCSGVERRADAAQHRRRLRAASGLSPRHQVRAARRAPRSRQPRPGVPQAVSRRSRPSWHRSQLHAVTSTIDAERDAVPRKRHEAVGGDVAQQPAHAEEAPRRRTPACPRSTCRGRCQRAARAPSTANTAPAMVSVGIARKNVNSVAARRDSPNNMPPMIVAPERLVPGMSANACAMPTFSASSAVMSSTSSMRTRWLAPLGPQDDQAAEDEGGRHRRRVEQVRLQQLAEGQSEQRQRHEGDRHVDQQAARAGLAPSMGQHVTDARAVLPHHGQDRCRLDDDLEQLAAFVVEIQQRAGEDQMAGGRDRQKLGQAFDDTHHRGLGQQHRIQIVPPVAQRRMIRAAGVRFARRARHSVDSLLCERAAVSQCAAGPRSGFAVAPRLTPAGSVDYITDQSVIKK